MDLRGWNLRLATHFGELARARKDIPIFALEHGLTPDDVQELSAAIRTHIRLWTPSRDHALAWIAYAAELGYRYAGDEYWQTFEAETPGWTERGDRGWIRDVFVAFREKFGGAEPSGAWAKQFSIICWPITHAILPRDLQQQLARILYELRHSFSAELFDAPLLLGQFIASRSWNTSARFQNLIQEPALVGQIAAALLLQGKEGFRTLLHPTTLRRIGDDVDRERRGREWLRDARRAAEERARIRGLTLGKPATTPVQRRDEARAEVARLGVEPRLVLRPMEGALWEVLLELPDLSHLLLRFPHVREVLTDSRCTVAGAAGRPLARGRCLHGPQRIALARWPRSDEVLLKFERIEPQLEYLLRTECLLRPGSSWLFKVASDGLAYESRGMRVRAGSRYLLLSTTPLTRTALAGSVDLTCKGVFGVLLDVPSALTPEWEQALRELQVTQAKSIEVWPAGLAAVAWDGEGHGEWLASERPTLAVRSDHPIDELVVSMGDGGASLSLSLTDTPIGEPVFIELPPLGIGLHKFSVAARGGRGADAEVIGDLDVVMRVREARPWSPGITPHGPLMVEVDPAAPTLEQLWEGKIDLSVRGPAERPLRCRVLMFTHAGGAPSFERQLPAVTLPLAGGEWRRHFESNVKANEAAQRAYDDARVCEVEFSADELGAFTLRCEREFTPLRWSLRRAPSGFVARLHDDAGSGAPLIERYSFDQPTVAERLQGVAEHAAPRAGGLYVATLRDFKASIIVPSIVRGLAELKREPRIDVRDRTPESVSQLLSLARRWGTARLSGDLIAGARQRLVIRAITAHILSLLGGQAWRSAETNVGAPNGLADLKRSISQDRSEAGIGAKLQLEYEALADTSPAKRVASLASLAESFRLVPPSQSRREIISRPRSPGSTVVRRVQGVGPDCSTWLAEFALRMASDPVTLEAWAGEHIDASINKLLEVPTLARAARFLVLAVDQQKKHATAGEIYAGWGWS
ncbi:hypothetical protein [Sorangium sp. So ce117]|uniref:hypothetical protein n=1 Tax=Sorangium sp. So ce117 TaxID=3133277 RepID=UPI003F63812D